MTEIITNYVALSDLIATSGQPTREQFAHIAQQGYAVVINLALPDSNHAIPDEGSIVTSLAMAYIHIPVSFEQPTLEHLHRFFAVMEAWDGKKVWVHCVRNWRVSAFMYHYLRLEKHWPDALCRSPVLAQWQPSMNQVWQSFLSLSDEEIMAVTKHQ